MTTSSIRTRPEQGEIPSYQMGDFPMPGRTRVAACIDPGHGGASDLGRSTAYGGRGPRGTFEKDVNLHIAERVRAHLGGRGALTRDGDYNVSIRDRLDKARQLGAPAFVSIHANSGPPGRRGAEVWVYGNNGHKASARSFDLAASIQRELGLLDGSEVPICEGALAALHPDHHGDDVAACLVEVDYLSDAAGEERLGDPSAIDAIAQAIARGVLSLEEPTAPAHGGGWPSEPGSHELYGRARALDGAGKGGEPFSDADRSYPELLRGEVLATFESGEVLNFTPNHSFTVPRGSPGVRVVAEAKWNPDPGNYCTNWIHAGRYKVVFDTGTWVWMNAGLPGGNPDPSADTCLPAEFVRTERTVRLAPGEHTFHVVIPHGPAPEGLGLNIRDGQIIAR